MVLNAIAFNPLISTCDKGEQHEQALALSKAMQRQGVVPSLITYTALLSTCETDQQPEQTYSTLVGVCEND